MKLIEEIRLGFANLPSYGMMQLQSLPNEYPGYVVRDSNGYGVAIEILDNDYIISEHFANARYHTCSYPIGNIVKKFIVLQCYREDLRIEFASLCTQFLDPGKDGEARIKLLENPTEWWNNWRDLLGNRINERTVYSIIAELYTLNYILQFDKTAEWSGNGSGTHDIECQNVSIEVKSTINKYSSKMTASGQFQLNANKPLYIYFLRMEPSITGHSINSLIEELKNNGYDENKLEQMLLNRGYEKGSSSRELRYDILEERKYDVDDNFPKIIDKSFKNDIFPKAIVHIEYTIDLDAVDYTTC